MADDTSHEPLFRATKRQKVFRKRRGRDEDEIESTSAPTAPDDDDHPRQIARRPMARKHGVAFSSATRTQREEPAQDETAMVMHPDRQQHMAQVDRFVKPTGNAKVVDDKHLTAYVDSKLAEMRASSTATPINHQPLILTSAPEEEPGHSQRQQPQAQDVTESRTIDVADTPSTSTYLRPTGLQQQQQRDDTTKSKPRRRRHHEPDPSTLARGSLIDQILQESHPGVPLYDTSATATIGASATTAGDGAEGDNDEAVAEAFKKQFLKDMETKIRRKPVGYSAAREKGVESHGPKLGGSRAQRARMRKAKEEERAAGKK
ncbi:60S ribosomal protein L27a [Teratosphaeria destructans]|uniref:60S ribosomal protein L27a n=1 Tax=Teratosphaeria destructans TaxID=418781 RepID=A0A9W7SYL6_9PEZI|nr:60S ribosomal protein L27a [Teratosphaeria destructans]